jgi:uncharacterized protein YjbI with pentapeptide repeats
VGRLNEDLETQVLGKIKSNAKLIKIQEDVIIKNLDPHNLGLPMVDRPETKRPLLLINRSDELYQVNSTIIIKDCKIEVINFHDVVFEKPIVFKNVHFTKSVDFSFCVFNLPCIIENCIFDVDANFIGSIFEKKASFKGCTFNKKANFTNTKFKKAFNFNGSLVLGKIDFWFSKFKDADFSDVKFNDDSDFRASNFAGFLRVDNFKFNRMFVEWDSIKDHLHPIGINGAWYLDLIKNFANISYFDDAHRCYYDYRVFNRFGGDCREGPKNAWSKCVDFLAQWIYGYGVRPLYPTIWFLFLIITSALIFGHFGGLDKYTSIEISEDSAKFESAKIFDNFLIGPEEISPIEYLIFSFNTCTYGLLSPILSDIEFKPKGFYSRLGILLMRLFGSFLIALIVTTIVKTKIRPYSV